MVEYYLALKRHELPRHKKVWKHLKNTQPREATKGRGLSDLYRMVIWESQHHGDRKMSMATHSLERRKGGSVDKDKKKSQVGKPAA